MLKFLCKLVNLTSSYKRKQKGMFFFWTQCTGGPKNGSTLIFRSSPRRWPSRLELRCVRLSVQPQKVFSDFHLIWCVGRPRPHMRTSVTSTRSKVKVKVMELPKLRKVHFSRSISSAISAWSSKLMVGGHSMGPGLQLVGALFLNFHLGKLSREFKHRPISIFDKIQTAIFRYCVTLQSRGLACR